MSDPLSITASVAGLVAFGFNTCTAAMSYLDALKSRSQEIESSKRQARLMHNLLTTIETSVRKVSFSHDSSVSAVRDCIAICTPEIAAPENLVSELQISAAGDQDGHAKLSMKAHGHKITYPFHRPKLEKLQAQLAKVTGPLQMALQVAGLDVTAGVEKAILTMQDSTLPKSLPCFAY